MDRLKELLAKLTPIIQNANKEHYRRDKSGENFNVFKVLNLQRDEERLHSAFIAELLNPQGAHGMRDTFLKLFKKYLIDCFEEDVWDFDTQTATVHTEYCFHDANITSRRKANGKIDILIESKDKTKGIIIENKIDACDQKEQLLRYWCFGESRYKNCKNFRLIYLTLDGKDAPIKSTGKEDTTLKERIQKLNSEYISLSYKVDITNWINNSIKKCNSKTNLNESVLIKQALLQYKNNLNDIFGMMNDENVKSIVKLVASPQNAEATVAIIKHQKEIQKEILIHFYKEMKRIAEDFDGLQCETYGDFFNLKPHSGLIFFYPRKHWCLFIGANKYIKRESVLYGIMQRKEDGKKIPTAKKLKNITPVWKGQCAQYPLGVANLYWDYEETQKTKWWDWKDWKTTEAMANHRLAKWIKDNIFREVFKGGNLLHKKNLLTYIENNIQNIPDYEE